MHTFTVMNSSDTWSRRKFGGRVLKLVLASSGVAGLLQIEGARAQVHLTVDLTDPKYTALQTVGGAVRLTPEGSFDPVIIVRIADDDYAAYSSTCPHRNCLVELPDEDGIVLCPCHVSTFDIRGRYIAGPARADLPPVELEILSPTAVQATSWAQLKNEQPEEQQ